MSESNTPDLPRFPVTSARFLSEGIDIPAVDIPAGMRPVAVGEEVGVVLPHSEVCMHMRVADQLRTVRILDQGAQILNADGTEFSFPIGHGEAGVIVRGKHMWAQSIPAELWCARKDGRRASPFCATENAAWVWVLKHQAQSVDYALRYGGYSIDLVPDALATTTGIRDLRVGDLVIDPQLRPDIDPTTPEARHTISVYDRGRIGTLVVSQRPDGTPVVLDGYLRRHLILAREHVGLHVPCHVLVGQTRDQEKTLVASLQTAPEGEDHPDYDPELDGNPDDD